MNSDGVTLGRLRDSVGKTQRQLAAEIGRSVRWVRVYEAGQALPRRAIASAMAAALDVRFPDLREILRFRWRQVHGLPLSLAELRRESLIESAELAEELAGLPHQFVTRLELGSRRPRSARLEALARVYGVDVSEVIGAMRRTMPEKRLSIEDLLDPADVAELVVRAEPFGGLAALFALVLRQLRQRRRREGVV